MNKLEICKFQIHADWDAMMSLPPILSPIQPQGWVVFHITQTLSLHVGKVDPRAVSFVSFHNPSTGLKFSFQYCFMFLFFRKKFVSGGPYHRRHLRLSTDEVSPDLWFGEVIWVFDPGINRQILLIEGSGIRDKFLCSWIRFDDGDVHLIPQLDYSSSMEEEIMVTNRQRWIRRYKRHDPEPFQAICQCVRLFKVMRKAFGSFISLDLLMRQRPPRKPPWNQPTTEDGDAIMMRIRRSDQQQVWVYATITKLHISFFRRVPKSRVLRCNGWIADFDFRKRKRWCIDKKKMFPKLESHTRLTDTTKATKHIIRIAALELFCFFVTNLFDCVHTLMF